MKVVQFVDDGNWIRVVTEPLTEDSGSTCPLTRIRKSAITVYTSAELILKQPDQPPQHHGFVAKVYTTRQDEFHFTFDVFCKWLDFCEFLDKVLT